jgi:hypothetical protein
MREPSSRELPKKRLGEECMQESGALESGRSRTREPGSEELAKNRLSDGWMQGS